MVQGTMAHFVNSIESHCSVKRSHGLATRPSLRSYFAFIAAEGEIAKDPTQLLESPRSSRYLPSVLTGAERPLFDNGNRGMVRY